MRAPVPRVSGQLVLISLRAAAHLQKPRPRSKGISQSVPHAVYNELALPLYNPTYSCMASRRRAVENFPQVRHWLRIVEREVLGIAGDHQ